MAEQGAHPGKVNPQQAVRLRFRNIRRQFFPFPQTVSESYVGIMAGRMPTLKPLDYGNSPLKRCKTADAIKLFRTEHGAYTHKPQKKRHPSHHSTLTFNTQQAMPSS